MKISIPEIGRLRGIVADLEKEDMPKEEFLSMADELEEYAGQIRDLVEEEESE